MFCKASNAVGFDAFQHLQILIAMAKKMIMIWWILVIHFGIWIVFTLLEHGINRSLIDSESSEMFSMINSLDCTLIPLVCQDDALLLLSPISTTKLTNWNGLLVVVYRVVLVLSLPPTSRPAAPVS